MINSESTSRGAAETQCFDKLNNQQPVGERGSYAADVEPPASLREEFIRVVHGN